ncbi:hypothetical protein Tco_1111598 [Tanacetum coccineum]|uniref:Uncharacterized protein n=1 Tax=Tanacetum coccineum TaxID=301880 RepID=A0ABQ5IM38_9ASTR
MWDRHTIMVIAILSLLDKIAQNVDPPDLACSCVVLPNSCSSNFLNPSICYASQIALLEVEHLSQLVYTEHLFPFYVESLTSFWLYAFLSILTKFLAVITTDVLRVVVGSDSDHLSSSEADSDGVVLVFGYLGCLCIYKLHKDLVGSEAIDVG